jgi:hypothetical protein
MKSIQQEVMSCQEFVELVTEFLEDALPAGQKARFEQHMHFCEGCVTYLGQIRATATMVGETAEDRRPEESELDELAAVFRRWKQSQGL